MSNLIPIMVTSSEGAWVPGLTNRHLRGALPAGRELHCREYTDGRWRGHVDDSAFLTQPVEHTVQRGLPATLAGAAAALLGAPASLIAVGLGIDVLRWGTADEFDVLLSNDAYDRVFAWVPASVVYPAPVPALLPVSP